MSTLCKGQELNRGSKNVKEQGIALTVMLVVLMFAATLSFGTLFLTQNNLKVAENIRNHAIAKYNAEAGIEVSHIMLNDDWKKTGKMATGNTIESMVPLAVSASETEFSYYLDPEVFNSTNNNIYLAIIGKSGPDASYTTEMLAKAVPASTSQKLPLPIYGQGIVSKKTVSINGMANTKLSSSGVHGNKGYTLNGRIKTSNITTCTELDEDGTCDQFDSAADPWSFFSASAGQGSYTCNANPRSKLCPNNEPINMGADPFNPWNADGALKEPQPPVINPEASLLLGLFSKGLVSAQELQNLGYLSANVDLASFSLSDLADTNGDGAANYDANYGPTDDELNLNAMKNHICSQANVNHYNGQPINRSSDLYGAGFQANEITCVNNHWVNLPKNSDLSGMTIIVTGGGINFNGDVNLQNTTLATSAGINLKSGTIDSSLVYAKQDLNLNKNAEIKGVTSILSGSNITHNGSTVIASTDDGPVIGLNIVSKGNITFNGRSDTYGIYQSRGTFIQNGHSDMYGSVLAENDVILNGGIEYNSSIPYTNPTLEAVEITEQEGGFVITGRR